MSTKKIKKRPPIEEIEDEDVPSTDRPEPAEEKSHPKDKKDDESDASDNSAENSEDLDDDDEEEEEEDEGFSDDNDFISSDDEDEVFVDWVVVKRSGSGSSGGTIIDEGDCSWRFAVDTCVSIARKGGSVKRTRSSVIAEGKSGATKYVKFTSTENKDVAKQLYVDVVSTTKSNSELCSECTMLAAVLV